MEMFKSLIFILLIIVTNAYALKKQFNPALFINDLELVNRTHHPESLLSFPSVLTLLKHPSSNETPSTMVESWIERYAQGTPEWGSPVMPSYQKLLDSWPRTISGDLDFSKKNFILSAVINRLDGANDFTTDFQPQLRLEYEVYDFVTPTFVQSLLIIEIAVSKDISTKAWKIDMAKRWQAYKHIRSIDKLEKSLRSLTEDWIKASKKSRQGRINFNLMDFLTRKTVDIAAFCFDGVDKILPCLSKHMPRPDLKTIREMELTTWFWENKSQLEKGPVTLPVSLQGQFGQFTARSPEVFLSDLKTHLDPTVRQARQNFSVNTCVGCHTAIERVNDENLMIRERFQLTDVALPTKFVQETEFPKRELYLKKLLYGHE